MIPKNVQEEINNISKQIIEKYKPQKVILFGSAANNKFTSHSDLDFFIIKEDVPYLGRDRSRQLRRMINKHVAADFIIYKPEEFNKWFKLGDPFLKLILSEGKTLYES